MEKHLLRTMLLAITMLMGVSAWGQTQTTLLEYGTKEKGWTTETLAEWTAGGSPTIVDNSYVQISGGNGSYATSQTISPEANSILKVTAVWRGRSNTGRGWDKNGNCSYFRFGNIVVAQNDQTQAYGYCFKGLDSIPSALTTFNPAGFKYRVEIENNPWMKIELKIDMAHNKLAEFYVSSEDGEKRYAEAHDVPLTNADYTSVAFGYHKTGGVSTTNTENLKSLVVVQTTQNVSTANYTVKFVCNGAEVKTAQTRTGTVGAEIILTDDDFSSFFNEGGTVKYVYVSDDSKGMTVASDGSTVVTVTFREAALCNWSSVICGPDGYVLKYNVVTGQAWEGEEVKVPYSRYFVNEGTLYYRESTDKEYNYKATITRNNQVVPIFYDGAGIYNVVYCSEAEDIDGMTPITTGNAPVRSSMSAAAYATSDVTITTLPAGIYRLHVIAYDSNKTPNSKWYFKKGDELLDSIVCTTSNFKEFDTDEFTLTKATPIILVAGGSSRVGIDHIYIVKTSDLSQEQIDELNAKDDLAAAISEAKKIDTTGKNGAEALAAAITAAERVYNNERSTPKEFIAARLALTEAVTAFYDANFEAQDCTAMVSTQDWLSDQGNVLDYTNDVAQKESYLTSTYNCNGNVLYQQVNGLEDGTYTVELYANASFTSGRGFYSPALDGEVGRVVVFAGDVEKTIPVVYQTAVETNNIVTLENVVVSKGTLLLGMRKLIAGSNWHTIQIKSLTRVKASARPDMAAQNLYWKGIAQTVAAYPAYANVGGYEKAFIDTVETKADAQIAITAFYYAKYGYDHLANAIEYAKNNGYDCSEAEALLTSPKTTADIADQKADELNHAVNLYFNTQHATPGADMTYTITNPSFEWGNTGGWDYEQGDDSGARDNREATYTMTNCEGDYLFNTWTGGLWADGNALSQTVYDLPDGNYRLQVVVASDEGNQIRIFAGNAQKVIDAQGKGVGVEAELDFEVKNNTAVIGVAGVRECWYKADNFRLTYLEAVSKKQLIAPAIQTGSYYNDYCEIYFPTSVNMDGEDVAVTIYYKIGESDYTVYRAGGVIGLSFGSTISYYATNDDYLDSPVITMTASSTPWSTMSELWWENFGSGEDQPITLHEDEPVTGLHPLMVGADLISNYLLTPDENINENFKLSNNGIYSAEERTYAITGLTKGQVVEIGVYDTSSNSGGGVIKSRADFAKQRKAARRIISPNARPRVTAVSGMELDAWNAWDEPGEVWKDYCFRVTEDGTVVFKVAAEMSMYFVSVYSVRPPETPYFNLTKVEGANRTYVLYEDTPGCTLYYTTTPSEGQPVIGGPEWSSTKDSRVLITTTGVGMLFAYAENEAGVSGMGYVQVNGVEPTLNAPMISSKYYDSKNDNWTVYLYSDQSSVEGWPDAQIYYRIGEGEDQLYTDYFTIDNGATMSMWTTAEGYKNSPVVTLTAEQIPDLNYEWDESYTYAYSNYDIALGTEVVTGLFQLNDYNGNVIRSGHLLTPDENIGSGFQMTYYYGIQSETDRVYAVTDVKAGQYLYVYYRYATPAAVEGVVLDAWNSENNMAVFKITANGTAKFKLIYNGSSATQLREITLYKKDERGDVDVADANGNVLTYHYDDATSPATLTGIKTYADDKAKAGRIVIADEVTDTNGNTHEVKYIGGNVNNRDSLVSVVFGQNIVSVGGTDGNDYNAFANCGSLVSVTLNNKVETIGTQAFYNCTALTSVNFEDATALKTIMRYGFGYCPIESLAFSGAFESLGSYAFYGCDAVKTITCNMATIPQSFFTSHSSLKTINIGKDVKSIGNSAFQSNYGVTAINFDPEVSGLAIGSYAFQNADSVTTLTLPAGIASIGEYAFYGMDELLTVTFDEASPVTAIPNYCFSSCGKLETVTLADSVKTLGNSVFSYCYNLREVTFGTGLIADGFANDYYLFYNCSNLEKMTIPGINFPFTRSYYGPPTSMMIFVHPDMVETYKTNDYTKKYHIMAIGSTTEYAITTTEGGQVATQIPAEVAVNVLSLTVTGPINGTDINQIHETMPYLERLDLSNAQIVEGGEDYYRFYISSNVPQRETYYHWPTENNVIGQYMFYNMPNLKQLALPNGATTMGQYAVAEDRKLTRVSMPAALTAIGSYAFNYDMKLTDLDIPSGVTVIGEYAFCEVPLKTVVIPEGVTRIENCTFYNNTGLTSLTLPAGLTYIGSSAFYYCTNLESLTLPDSLVEIGYNAFYECYKLASPLVIPAKCKTIGNSAFYECRLLPSVTFNEGLEKINSGAFQYCSALQEVSLPSSLTAIDNYAFANTGLKSFTFPENVKVVSYYVLRNCNNLESVTLAEGTTSVLDNAFAGCSKLAMVNNLNQETLTTLGGYVFNGTALTSVTLPNSITSMGEGVFYNCSKLQSANIPTNITSVPYSTFNSCSQLNSVTLHDGINTIGAYAFAYCQALPSIALNDSIKRIYYYAFQNCSNLVIDALPATLTEIGYYAFAGTTAITAHLTLPETLTTIGDDAFERSGITGITIPKVINSFGTGVFYECKSLATVNLPMGMTKIPNYTFYYTTALKSITLPTSLTEIGSDAFEYSGVTSVALPSTLTTIGSYAFARSKLTRIELPKSVTSVGTQFAAYCDSLTEAYLGRSMDYSKNSNFNYFRGCSNLALLRVYAGTPPGINSTYVGYRSNCVLEVPDGQVETYQATSIWNEFKEIRAFESPEMLNDADFAMMQQMYSQLDGANWTKPWDLTSQRHANAKWNGVTTVVDENDNELYYITAIDLTGQGLTGQLPKSLFTLPKLTTVNLSHNAIEAKVDELMEAENSVITELNFEGNHLTGDLYPFASQLPELTKLNVSYNRLTDVSDVIPNTKLSNSNLIRGYQFIDYATKQVIVPDEMADSVVIDMTVGDAIDLPDSRFQTYRHNYGDWNLSPTYMSRYYRSSSYLYTSDTELYKNNDGKWEIYPYYLFQAPKDVPVAYTHGTGNLTYIFRFHWNDGDVNGDQTVDVNDLQNVIYYALNDGKPVYEKMYNFTAADANKDSKINVSDVVGCVSYILNYDDGASTSRARISNNDVNDSRNRIALVGNKLCLNNADEVAALQITILGAKKNLLSVDRELLNHFTVTMRDVEGGVKMVVYSTMGNTLTPGQNMLLSSMPAGTAIAEARATDSRAQALGVSVDNQTTGIEALDIDFSMVDTIYDLSGRRVGQWQTLPRGIYVIYLNGKQLKVRK